MKPVPESPLRVLMAASVFPRWPGDDTPPFVLRQAEAIAAAGVEVTVLAPHAPGAKARERWGQVNVCRFRYLWPTSLQGLFYEGGMLVQLGRYPHRKWQLPFMLFAQVCAMRKLCHAKSYDVLHAHSLLPQGFTAMFNGALPVVATSHGNDVFRMKATGLYGKMKRKVVCEAAALTANSSATEKALVELGAEPGRIHRVPASPNVGQPTPKGADEIRKRYQRGAKIVLFVGRLLEEKGVGDLIEALGLLHDESVRLVVVGAGVDEAGFQAKSRDLGLASRIDFVGWADQEQLANYLAAATIFVGPSKPRPGGGVEAQGLVFAEAMAAGLPVVATRCGGIPDMIIDGQTGLLVEPGDPHALAAAMKRLFDDPALAQRLSKAARQHYFDQFSPEATTHRMIEVYRSVLNASTTV